jgi:hypothetical protein
MLSTTDKTRLDGLSPVEGLGTILSKQKGVVKATYDFAVLGGAVGSVSLLGPDGKVVTLPDDAIITQAYIEVLTAMTSTGNNGTIALKAQSAGDLLAAVDADTLSGIVAGIPVGSAATMIKLTAARTLMATIATNALLSGKFDLFVEYVQGQ